ncbi:MAG: DnaD domain protein [Herpetosiphon sp.]
MAMTFTGFTTEDPIKLPHEFFTEVLPSITQPVELKLSLHMFYLLKASRRRPRMVEWNSLLNDLLLARSLRAIAPLRSMEDVIVEGIEAAVRRGTLLHVLIPDGPRVGNWYLANTEQNRNWAARAGDDVVGWVPAPASHPERPSIFATYEQNIGVLTPLLATELREAEQEYPGEWCTEAIHEAVRANKRSWRYIRAILERWKRDGRADNTSAPDNDAFRKYANMGVYDLFEPNGHGDGERSPHR